MNFLTNFIIAKFYLCILYRYQWNTAISELNKNDNFTSEITIFISLALYFAPFRCQRHMKTSSLKRKNHTLFGFVYASIWIKFKGPTI
jgi:hypothetical protein